jgi:hypothetical protein
MTVRHSDHPLTDRRKLYVRKKPRGDHLFKPGNPGRPGRPKGSADKFTREIKQAVLDAAEFVGEEIANAEDPEGKNPDAPRGITAYLVHVARNHAQTNVRNARSHDADPKRNDAVRQRHNPAWVKGHPGASRLFAYREFSSGDVDVLDVCHLFPKQATHVNAKTGSGFPGNPTKLAPSPVMGMLARGGMAM